MTLKRKAAKNPPERIFLQIDEDDDGVDWDEVTWCRKRVNDSDVEYVRAALQPSTKLPPALDEEDALKRLRDIRYHLANIPPVLVNQATVEALAKVESHISDITKRPSLPKQEAPAGAETILHEMETVPFAVGRVTLREWAEKIRASLPKQGTPGVVYQVWAEDGTDGWMSCGFYATREAAEAAMRAEKEQERDLGMQYQILEREVIGASIPQSPAPTDLSALSDQALLNLRARVIAEYYARGLSSGPATPGPQAGPSTQEEPKS
jgi:hypothetical protein